MTNTKGDQRLEGWRIAAIIALVLVFIFSVVVWIDQILFGQILKEEKPEAESDDDEISLDFTCRAEAQIFPVGTPDTRLLKRRCKRAPIDDRDACIAWGVLETTRACGRSFQKDHDDICERYEDSPILTLGSEVYTSFVNQPHVQVEDSEWVRHVGYHLLKKRTSSEMCFPGEISFRVYHDEVEGSINALAFPNGAVLVGRELVGQVTEAELAAVIGHEIGHIERGSFDLHVIIESSKTSQSLLSKLKDIRNAALFVCEGGMDELQVDLWGIDLAERAGYDPMAGVTLHKRVFGPRDNRAITDVSWLAHPPSSLRQAYIADHARTLAARSRDGWPHDVYFRGRPGVQSHWDGVVDPSSVAKCRNSDSVTWCGDPAHNKQNRDGWETYRCQNSQKIGKEDRKKCLPWSKYADSEKYGCKGGSSMMCCPH